MQARTTTPGEISIHGLASWCERAGDRVVYRHTQTDTPPCRNRLRRCVQCVTPVVAAEAPEEISLFRGLLICTHRSTNHNNEGEQRWSLTKRNPNSIHATAWPETMTPSTILTAARAGQLVHTATNDQSASVLSGLWREVFSRPAQGWG